MMACIVVGFRRVEFDMQVGEDALANTLKFSLKQANDIAALNDFGIVVMVHRYYSFSNEEGIPRHARRSEVSSACQAGAGRTSFVALAQGAGPVSRWLVVFSQVVPMGQVPLLLLAAALA